MNFHPAGTKRRGGHAALVLPRPARIEAAAEAIIIVEVIQWAAGAGGGAASRSPSVHMPAR
jgi:hypothetical protein